jgi:ankyrin repeat protein
MSNSNNNSSNNNAKNKGPAAAGAGTGTKKKKQRSAAAKARRSAKWATQKAETAEKQQAKKAEEERKTKSVLEMFPDIMGIIGSRGFMPNIKRSTLLSKNLSASLKKVPLFQNVDRSTIYPNGMTMLNKYLEEENWAEAMKILDQGVSKEVLNHPSPISKLSPLVYVYEHHQYDLFKKLLEKGCNPNILLMRTAKHGIPFLHYVATTYGSEEERIPYIKALLAKKVDINQLDSLGYSVLEAVIARNDPDIAKVLIDSGADLQKPNKKGFTAVLTAIANSRFDIFKYMMEKEEIDINKETGANELSPLKIAVINGNKSMLEEVLQYEPNLDQKDAEGNTPLHYAVLTKNYDKIILLKQAGANARISNKQGLTALELAKAAFGKNNEPNPKAVEAYTLLKE